VCELYIVNFILQLLVYAKTHYQQRHTSNDFISDTLTRTLFSFQLSNLTAL